MRLKPVYIFNILAIFILSIFIVVYYFFQDIKKLIIDTNYKSNISYVKNISDNIAKLLIKKVNSTQIETTLSKNVKLRKELENTLSLFITNRYKYIYVVEKKDNSFRFLLDGSTNEDKAIFLESYEPIELSKWNKVYKTKKDIYFTHSNIKSLWMTYLKPIIINNEIKAVLVIDFSMKEHLQIEKALNKLAEIFKILIYFFIFTFIIIIWFSIVDYKRDKQLSNLNKTLEKRVTEEIEKNRQKDEQLLYQSRLAQMGEMISMIAHQWRQPLSAISASAISIKFKIQMGKIDNKLLEKKMDNLINYTAHLSSTIEDFRNFFKPTKQKELISFEDILNSVLDIIEITLRNKNIILNVDVTYKNKILVFSNELKQVILNLIKNAEDVLIEKNIENKQIDIRVYKKNDNIIFEIEDNGGGIKPEHQNKIFEPYFSTKDSKNGTGLGLYMSKIIVEKHLKGNLTFINTDNGVIFRIILKESE